MNRKKNRLTDARRLALTDADIAHLRLAIESSARDDHPALPPAYWRHRLKRLVNEGDLLPKQRKKIDELLERLDAGPFEDGA
ncbi:hypothetical protein AWB79_07348 [Caballeronia hypogeia]|uniref:Uncharacterized protein n=1 Tax=Caballeronia hypogeia TaxID=1777140 RepID=A0A158DPL2_9BURK|nr:hypothetical protein [Caballeronia hypogeia]SAK96559.1 hypothetical protein AWB79_07348 [Caballeronia hypogeia]